MFVAPEFEVVKFNVVDVITTSTETTTEAPACSSDENALPWS